MAKPSSLSQSAQEYLKTHSVNHTIPEIASKFKVTYNAAIFHVRFNNLPYKGTRGDLKGVDVKEGYCPISGFKL